MSAAERPTPTFGEPIVAWRAWGLGLGPDGRPELRPVIYSGESWPARTSARATCPPHGRPGHLAPERECTCGLYAVDGLDRIPTITGRDVTVIGSVALWGRVLEHDAGYRAELGYPQRLRLVCGSCWAAGRLRADVVDVAPTTRGTLLGLCADHAPSGMLEGTHRRVQSELVDAYAVDLLPDAAVQQIAAAWHHPKRGSRRGWSRSRAIGFAFALGFFGVYLGLVLLALSLR